MPSPTTTKKPLKNDSVLSQLSKQKRFLQRTVQILQKRLQQALKRDEKSHLEELKKYFE